MKSLTVSIPTYNRNEELLFTLSKLLPQVKDEKIIIIDNESDIPVKDSLTPLLNLYPDLDVKIYRNRTNLGICGNFLRCFEYCETEWMWLLSDDDTPCPDSLEMIHTDIVACPDYTFINYASKEMFQNFGVTRDVDIHTTGLSELIKGMDVFSNFIFVSAGVYNIKKVIGSLRFGYIYSYSLIPHIAVVLNSIGDNDKVLMSHKENVIFNQPTYANTWSRLIYTQGVNLALEMPLKLDDECFRLFFDKINVWCLSDQEIFDEVNLTYNYSSLKKQYVFVQIMTRLLFKKRRKKHRLYLLKYLFKLFFPKYNKTQDVDTIGKKPLLHRI